MPGLLNDGGRTLLGLGCLLTGAKVMLAFILTADNSGQIIHISCGIYSKNAHHSSFTFNATSSQRWLRQHSINVDIRRFTLFEPS